MSARVPASESVLQKWSECTYSNDIYEHVLGLSTGLWLSEVGLTPLYPVAPSRAHGARVTPKSTDP